jgi:hypothetical protein
MIKPITQSEIDKLIEYIEDISEYTNPDGGGAYPAVTKMKSLLTRIDNKGVVA